MTSHPVWAEIDLGAISHNLNELRRLIDPKVRMLAAVKANAYGHGIIPVARQAVDNGVNMLGVARYEEGIVLRKSGIETPILIFGYTSPSTTEELLAYDLIPTVFSQTAAEAFSSVASLAQRKLKIHIKVDTGMGRIGLLPANFRQSSETDAQGMQDVEEIGAIVRMKGLEPEGIYTHFACADSADKTSADNQFECFLDLLARLSQRGIEFPIRHAANSAAVIDMPHTHLDMIRPGISVYGLYPSDQVKKERLSLKPAMALKAKISQFKHVPARFNISYGSTHITPAPTSIATVPIGYADGYSRMLSSRGYMLVDGQRAPVIGRVCMDLTMLDVGHIPRACPEAEIVILGAQGADVITADEIAGWLGTINYEIVATVMNRVPRIYI